MTDIAAATALPSSSSAAAAGSTAGRVAASRTRLADNYETFLGLLTTQLRNQDPLSPMDSNQFTQQIVQMTGVEQQLLTNDLLSALVDQGGGGGVSDAAAFIGRTITAESPTARLADGAAEWRYSLAGTAASATGEIRNTAGQVVWRGAMDDLGSGEHGFSWDGRGTAGQALPDGRYTLSVTALDRAGEAVAARILMRGVVTGVEQRDDGVHLITTAGEAPLSAVRGVVQTDA